MYLLKVKKKKHNYHCKCERESPKAAREKLPRAISIHFAVEVSAEP